MRAIEGGVRQVTAIGLLLSALLLPAAGPAQADPLDAIPDNQMTADQFDDTIAFDAVHEEDAAVPPLPVHEVDPAAASAAGGTKVIEGRTWLDAGDYARNDMLNEIQDGLPDGADLVIDVSTGDVWQVPLAEGALLPDAFRPWQDEEIFFLDEYADPPKVTLGPITRDKFAAMTAAAGGEVDLIVEYFKTFGPVGYQEIRSRNGFQVALAATWLRETPLQRYLRLVMLRNYFSRLPQFQGEANRLIFALMVPDGGLYAIPYFQYRILLAQSGIRPWTAYELLVLPTAVTLMDRQIRGERFQPDRGDP
jgi:hypothetical protein